MVLIPRFVVVDAIPLPLEVAEGFKYVNIDRNADDCYFPLAELFQELYFDEPARARLLQGERFVHRQAHRVHDLDPYPQAEDTWTRMSGRHREPDSYFVHGNYSGTAQMLVPYGTLLAIGKELWRLTDELRAGRLEPKVDLSTPLPPLPPAPPPRVYPPEPPDDDVEDEGAPVVAATPPPRVIAPPSSTDVLAGDVVLRDLERLATEVDQLAPLNQPASLEAQATAAAKRRTLLLGLDVAGLLSASLLDAALAALERLGLPTLSGYHRAARAMFQYLGSEARARFNPGPPPVNLLDADVSLDWFRLPPAPMPEDVTAEEWLGLVESHFVRFRRPGDGDGTSFARLEDGLWCLRWRPEVGPLARLWRATPG